MFIKRVKRTNGTTKKAYYTLHLVESFRTPNGPRQRLVLNLGDLPVDREQYKALANAIEARLLGHEDLVQESFLGTADTAESDVARWADEAVRQLRDEKQAQPLPAAADAADEQPPAYEPVDMASTQCSPARSIGAEHVAYTMYERLGLDAVLAAQGVTATMRQMIATLVIGRLISPGSELQTWRWVDEQSALTELLTAGGAGRPKKGSLNSLYRASDVLLPLQSVLESHLNQRERDLFDLPETLCFFDITNTFLEGSGAENDKAMRGHSKEKRSDCPLISLALLIDEHGFPKYSRVFPGNISEPHSLPQMIAEMRAGRPDLFADPEKPFTIIMDKGIATEASLAYLRTEQLHYIVAKRGRCELDPKQTQQVLREDPAKGITVTVQRGPRIENAETEGVTASNDVLLYCHSEKREKKETSMRSAQEKKLIAALEKLHAGLSQPRCAKSTVAVLERIGRIKEKYSRSAKLYTITAVPKKDDPNSIAAVTWEASAQHDSAQRQEGSYILRTNRHDLDDQRIWETYCMLTRVEAAFRHLKSDLGLRPCHHQKETRCDAHLFISVLAYHLLHSIEHNLRQAGDHRSWPTIKAQLSTHARLTVTANTPNGTVSIRTCTNPSAEQKAIYQRLGMTDTPLPKTMARNEHRTV